MSTLATLAMLLIPVALVWGFVRGLWLGLMGRRDRWVAGLRSMVAVLLLIVVPGAVAGSGLPQPGPVAGAVDHALTALGAILACVAASALAYGMGRGLRGVSGRTA